MALNTIHLTFSAIKAFFNGILLLIALDIITTNRTVQENGKHWHGDWKISSLSYFRVEIYEKWDKIVLTKIRFAISADDERRCGAVSAVRWSPSLENVISMWWRHIKNYENNKSKLSTSMNGRDCNGEYLYWKSLSRPRSRHFSATDRFFIPLHSDCLSRPESDGPQWS